MFERLMTAAEWCSEADVSILDPDGWKYENGMTEFFEKPITRDEFDRKFAECTGKAGFEEQWLIRLQDMAS